MFIEFETAQEALVAIKQADGHRLDKKHVFQVTSFSEIETIADLPEEHVVPETEEFVPREHLKSWLSDSRARDQYVVLKGNDVAVCWNNSKELPDEVTSRPNWTDSFVEWSPLGSYLLTMHQQGIALWGGPSWAKIARFEHPNVARIDFSPNERYLLSWSPTTFVTEQGANHVFVFNTN